MTLKEKFEEILIAFWTSEWEDECEKVADDFAIEFAEWVMNNCDEFPRIDQKLILKIFKKEKGL
jgi:hypothetical protein